MTHELKALVGKYAWFMDGILDVRKKSDAKIIEVSPTNVVLKNEIFGHINKIPIGALQTVARKD